MALTVQTVAPQPAPAVARTSGAALPSYTTSHAAAPCVTCSWSVSPFGGGKRAALTVPSSYLHSACPLRRMPDMRACEPLQRVMGNALDLRRWRCWGTHEAPDTVLVLGHEPKDNMPESRREASLCEQ